MHTMTRTLLLAAVVLWTFIPGTRAQGPLPATRSVPRPRGAMLNIKDGQTLSGEVLVRIRLTSPADEYGSVTLSVDRAYAGMGGDREGVSAADPFTVISLPTDEFRNGWHLLSVNAGRQAAHRRVKFSNDIHSISVDGLVDPESPGRRNDPPRRAHITAELAHARPWAVRIESTTDHPSAVRVYRGIGQKIDVRWDCKDGAGRVVPDDSYTVLLRAGEAPPHTAIINKDTRRA